MLSCSGLIWRIESNKSSAMSSPCDKLPLTCGLPVKVVQG